MDEKDQDEDKIIYSRRYKIRMNRVFREYGGLKRIPYPEVDNLFERIRSKVVEIYLRRKNKSCK